MESTQFSTILLAMCMFCGCSGSDKPLHRAVITGNITETVTLVNKGNDINAEGRYGRTPLFYAALTGHNEIMRYLLLSGADPHKGASWKGGDTPIHIAAERGNLVGVQLLINSGALIDERNIARQTPLSLAAHNRQVTMVAFLLKQGANVNAEDIMKATPLAYPSGFVNNCRSNYQEVVEMLLNYGANVNHVDRNGETALHEAVFMGDAMVVSILLNRGANPNVRGIRGTPLEWARQHGRKDIEKLLYDHGVAETPGDSGQTVN